MSAKEYHCGFSGFVSPAPIELRAASVEGTGLGIEGFFLGFARSAVEGDSTLPTLVLGRLPVALGNAVAERIAGLGVLVVF